MSEPIRVLAVVSQMNNGGLENRLMDIIRHLDHNRIQIDVFTYRNTKGQFDDEISSYGGIIYYNKPLTVQNMFNYVGYFKDFLLQHSEYRIVHAHQDAWCSVFCKGAYLAGVPVRIAHSRTAISVKTLSDCMKNLIKIPTKKYATHYFAVSNIAAKWLFGKRLVSEGHVQVWQNAIETDRYLFDNTIRNYVRRENNWEDRIVVMHVGNFTLSKNHSFLIKVFERLYNKNDNAILILIGSGDHRKEDSIVKDYGIQECVRFLGNRTDVAQLLQAADVFVFPSLFEGLPGAVIEAEAAGLQCIISDTISEEVCITPFVKRLSLNDDVGKWVDAIEDSLEWSTRTDCKPFFLEAGFDIEILVKRLSSFYLNAYRDS